MSASNLTTLREKTSNPVNVEINPSTVTLQNQTNVRIEKVQEEEKLIEVNQKETTRNPQQNSMSPSLKIVDSDLTEQKEVQLRQLSQSRRVIKTFMARKQILYLVIFLVVIYTCLVFITLMLDDFLDKTKSQSTLYNLLFVEIVILIIFQVEILLNSYSSGWKHYFRDKWLLFDAIIIVVSLILVLVDITEASKGTFQQLSSLLRGVFRFLRIFLLIRKVQTFQKIQTSSRLKTPADRITDFFTHMKDFFDNMDIIQDLEWSIEMISSNKLYQPVIAEGMDQNGDMNNWVNYGTTAHQDQADSGGAKLHQANTIKEHGGKQAFVIDQSSLLYNVDVYLLEHFKKADDISFDCFEMEPVSKGNELSLFLAFLFEDNELFPSLHIDPQVFMEFSKKIQSGYHNNPYHNKLHGFDVTQTVNFFLKQGQFQELAEVNDIELCSMYIAAACHDYDHPGYNNMFLVNSKHNFALLYNDQGVLENHHVSSTFQLLKEQKLNFTANFSKDQQQQFREIMVNVILSTDMAQHFADIGQLKGRLSASDFELQGKDKVILMEALNHAADISNPIKPFPIYQKWTLNIMAQFFNQGDQQKQLGLPVSFNCDRLTTNIAKGQGGFIDFIVQPLWQVIGNFLPQIVPKLENFQLNQAQWGQLIEYYDQQLKMLNEATEQKKE